MSESNLVQIWSDIEEGVYEILDSKTGVTIERYMFFYTLIYNYCTGSNIKGQHLYQKLILVLQTWMQKNEIKIRAYSHESLLTFYYNEWKRLLTTGQLVHELFSYINRYYVSNNANVSDVYTLVLESWRDNIFKTLHPTLVKVCLDLIERQRNGEKVDYNLIYKTNESFMSHGLDEYIIAFQEPFLDATQIFYTQESEKYVVDVVEYLKYAEIRLKQEDDFSMHFHASTRESLKILCENILLQNHQTIIQDEFPTLLNNEKKRDLERLYSLFIRIPNGLDKFCELFKECIYKQGLNSINDSIGDSGADSINPDNYINAILTINKQYLRIVCDCFSRHSDFIASLDKACTKIVNNNQICKNDTKSSEILVKFCDNLLKKSSRIEEGCLEDTFDNIMIIFKYIKDKDIFYKLYSQYFAKRLVNNTSSSDDAESMMIIKLQEECGFSYTSKLSQMFTDINLSKELNKAMPESIKNGIDCSIVIGTLGHWPFNPNPNTTFNIPDKLMKTWEQLQTFYTSKHPRRKLQWLFHLSKGEIQTFYLKTKYILQVSTYQMGILLQYNDDTIFTFNQLLSRTGLTRECLSNNLTLLVKFKILCKDEDTFTLNMDFKSKKIRINLNIAIKNDVKQEILKTCKIVEEDRNYRIQAAIVRNMKARKSIKHITLIEDVISQLSKSFQPKIIDIKKCIEILLEKEYIERHADTKDMYTYVA